MWDKQTVLENEILRLEPLQHTDFESLYDVAKDPSIWAMHPNKDRYKHEKFLIFFEGALKSQGAFKIILKKTGEIIGSTRYYDESLEGNSIFIGYTFLSVNCWGKGINKLIKKIMLEYAFSHVKTVFFHIGAENYRSRRSIEKLGAVFVKEQVVAYFGEPDRQNILYKIEAKMIE